MSTKRGAKQFGRLQCQYPGSGCTRERALKKNGERHWLCAEHRDHQNTLQRERYRRAVTKTKKVAEQTTVRVKRTKGTKAKIQGVKKKKEKPKRSHSSPHIFQGSVDRSEDDYLPSAVGSATTNNAPVAATAGNQMRGTPVDGVTHGVEAPAERQGAPAVQTGLCSCHSPWTQSPHVVYMLLPAVPLTLGASTQPRLAQQQDPGAAAPQGLQLMLPQLQYAISPSFQPCVGLMPSGSPPELVTPGHSSVPMQDPNSPGRGCSAVAQNDQTGPGRA